MHKKFVFLVIGLTLWLASAVPAPLQVPVGLTAAEWQAIQGIVVGNYFKASNTGVQDNFGSVAISGDTLVVGAYREGSNATGVNGDQTNDLAPEAGAAYVFVRTGGTWSQQAYLKASNAEAADHFGYAVAIDGDTIVVGAYQEASASTGVNGDQSDNSAFNAGAAYVFVRSGSTWTQQAYLKASNAGMFDFFGSSVAISGDTIMVGAYREWGNATGINGDGTNNDAFAAGAAYIFTRSGSTWSEQAYVKASNTDSGDQFGYGVAIDGDTAVVTAPNERSSATGVNGDQSDNFTNEAGAAYVFVRSGNTWSQQAYLKASNTEASDLFGYGLAVQGNTIVVGAFGEGSNATGINGDQSDNSLNLAGAVYLFERTGTVWSQQAYIKPSNTDNFDFFGTALALSGNRLLVGAGAVYLFEHDGTAWSQLAYLKASNTGSNDYFGGSVSMEGDMIAVGAVQEGSNAIGIGGDGSNNAAVNSGAAYTFSSCIRSAQSGAWEDGATWVGALTPLGTDGVCVEEGHTVTMNANHAIEQLWVYQGGTLDLATHTLTVEKAVLNKGTLHQNQVVNGNAVHFLHIQNGANTISQYRGVMIDASINGGNNLGNTTVSVQGLNVGEYCTDLGVASAAYARRCFEITPTNQPTMNVAVRLYGRTADELNGIAPASLAVYRNTPIPSGFWVEQTTNASTGNDGGAYSYAQGEVAGFSPFLLGATGQSPTAVTFSNLATRPASPWLWLVSGLALLGGTAVGLLRRRIA